MKCQDHPLLEILTGSIGSCETVWFCWISKYKSEPKQNSDLIKTWSLDNCPSEESTINGFLQNAWLCCLNRFSTSCDWAVLAGGWSHLLVTISLLLTCFSLVRSPTRSEPSLVSTVICAGGYWASEHPIPPLTTHFITKMYRALYAPLLCILHLTNE